MEDTHGVIYSQKRLRQGHVLILIIMEDTHGAIGLVYRQLRVCLNPYYNGRYSWSVYHLNVYIKHK